jgi:multidrug efflux pump subunit AcrB
MSKQGDSFSPFSVIVVFLALMVIGVAFVPLLDVRFQPDNTLPRLYVRYSWQNASPEVIEEQTSKIEGILGKITQVQSIESTSSVGSGVVTLNFDKSADLSQKRYEVSMLLTCPPSN